MKKTSILLAACWLLCVSSAPAQTLRIYHIDVEQADSALVVMPNGRTLLIDSGKNGHGKRIKAVMDQAGVTQIDAFVASHYHEDHFGGIDDLVEMGVRVLESYDRGRRDTVVAADKARGTYKDYMEAVGEDAVALSPGDTIDLDPLVRVTCIVASGAAMGSVPVTSSDENDLSVSLVLDFAGFKAFFGGDTHAPIEALIEAGHLASDVDLYKSNHHGSDTSPSLIVISNGSNGSYHHPRSVTLATYKGLAGGPVILQTNRCKLSAPCGNVGAEFIADAEVSGRDGTIQITVDALTRTYTAGYGLSTVRTFPFKAAGPAIVTPGGTSSGVIHRLLPNPAGDDEQLEEVAIRNSGTAPLALAGWMLRDRSGLTWSLSGSVAAGQSQTFVRGGQPMSLNNSGDEIVLLDASGIERDRFAYAGSSEDTSIPTTH
jgi:beta-lactamase superfamily II metal-dependent hydrolase